MRVLVGRMEIMPATQEREVLGLVQKSAAARQAADGQKGRSFRSPSLDVLLAMGRLAEPALVRAQNIAADEGVRDEAKRLLSDLRDAVDSRK